MIYRGLVLLNNGDNGKCKIFVPGIYSDEFLTKPESLPWAEPAMSLFGGNFTNNEGNLNTETGICAWPKKRAIVWLFFESGDHNKPIYFAYCQGANGWFSEHNRQMVLQTDNVKIRIDDNPSNTNSTSKFNSYNENCTDDSTQVSNIPTVVDIEITGPVNLKINGSVNLQVNGNVYSEINGDLNETIIGNHYKKHVGDLHLVHEGNTLHEMTGDETFKLTGNQTETISNNRNVTVDNNDSLHVKKTSTHINDSVINETYKTKTTQSTTESKQSSTLTVQSNTITETSSTKTVTVSGNSSEIVSGTKILRGSEIVQSGKIVKIN